MCGPFETSGGSTRWGSVLPAYLRGAPHHGVGARRGHGFCSRKVVGLCRIVFQSAPVASRGAWLGIVASHCGTCGAAARRLDGVVGVFLASYHPGKRSSPRVCLFGIPHSTHERTGKPVAGCGRDAEYVPLRHASGGVRVPTPARRAIRFQRTARAKTLGPAPPGKRRAKTLGPILPEQNLPPAPFVCLFSGMTGADDDAPPWL